jgi:3-keto-5-aminohexanoate cleavage enzyme
MSNVTWLEAALNGPWTRAMQPGIPIARNDIVEQAIACAGEGASIIHFHAYDESTGRQRDDYEIYAPIVERIRSRTDAICYPTLPLTASAKDMAPEQRYKAVEKLARAGLIEWTVLDPGSTNISTQAQIREGRDGFIYANSDADIRYGLQLSREYSLTPSYAIYEPGFIRAGAAMHRAQPGVPQPVYRFMFSDHFTFGFPPAEWALQAYLKLLAMEDANARWMIAGLGVELHAMIPMAVDCGGHVRVGLEDAPMGCRESNVDLVKAAAAAVVSGGGRLATAAEVRRKS